MTESIHVYIFRCMDTSEHLCVCLHACSCFIYMCAIFPCGCGPHKSVPSLNERLKPNTALRLGLQTIFLSLFKEIQMAQVYTSQYNALLLYTALLDMMCGAFVESHHKSTFTEAKITGCPVSRSVSHLKASGHSSAIVLRVEL